MLLELLQKFLSLLQQNTMLNLIWNKSEVLHYMEQIRSSSFEFNGKEVNGMVGLAIQLNPSLIDENIDDLVELEEKEFNLISEELNNLELKKDNEEIDPNSFEYLIYHLVYEGHNLTSKPANDFTREYHITEIKRLKELSGN